MNQSFFFYDLETSGLRPNEARIMQFAGQRTDMDLNPIGDPVNVLIKLTPDVLPDPDAVMLTGITPQQTLKKGITEAEFLEIFYDQVATPTTIFVGFNNIRFDDEFIRFLNYRNFYDPYAWSWQDQRSRWDILDLVRMTRALRPDGIEWPFKNSKPVNRLQELTRANKLLHEAAHDALSDVNATIAVATLIKDTQPKLFNYLLNLRSKAEVAKLIKENKPFVYTSSHYSADYLHTTVVVPLMPHPDGDAAIVYNLRQDPTPFLSMEPEELKDVWQFSDDPDALRLPVKTLKFNRVPAIAPLSVMDEAASDRLDLDLSLVQKNFEVLKTNPDFKDKLSLALTLMNKTREDKRLQLIVEADQDLYGGFIDNIDRRLFPSIHEAAPSDLDSFRLKLNDKRLKQLLPLYKARNFPESLNGSEKTAWADFCASKLNDERVSKYLERLSVLSGQSLAKKSRQVIDELKDYLEAVS